MDVITRQELHTLLSATWDRLTASDADATSLKKLASLWATVLVIEGVGDFTLGDSGEDKHHLGGQEGCVLAEVDTNIVSYYVLALIHESFQH